MLTINVINATGNKVISGTIDGEKYNVNFSEDLFKKLSKKEKEFQKIKTAVKYDAWVKEVKTILETKISDVIETACSDLYKDTETGNYFVKVEVDGKQLLSVTPVPTKLVAVILESVEKDIDPLPIIKAWTRFLRNRNFTTRKAELFADYITALIVDQDEVIRLMTKEGYSESAAISRATYNDVAITQEGLLVTKKYAQLLTEGWVIDEKTNKAVKVPRYGKEADTIDKQTGEITKGKAILPEFAEDLVFQPPVQGLGGDKFLAGTTEGHIIKVGVNHTLKEWSMVNTNDDSSCVKGLHVGGWKYVSSYKNLKCQLLECFVDPMEIGAICGMYPGSDGAIRVREYFVFGAVEGRTKGIYHSSNYAAIKDAEWTKFKKEAIEKSNKLIAKAKKVQSQAGL